MLLLLCDVFLFQDNSERLLGHPHEWVRFSATQLLGQIISVVKPEDVADIINGEKPERAGYLMNETRERVKSFALDHCYQLMPGIELNEKLLMRVIFCCFACLNTLQYLIKY